MPVELLKEKWVNNVFELTLGAVKAENGTRGKPVKCGAEEALPLLFAEGKLPNPPVVAMEIFDVEPTDWPKALTDALGSALKNPVDWAVRCEKEFKADLLCLRLIGAHPDTGNRAKEELEKLLKDILKSVGVPLIIVGCGDDAKDNEIIPHLSQVTKGEKLLFGEVSQDNYKTITASVLADGHNIIAQSPIDINIAKQLNILISDMGLPPERIIINPTVGALGYGLEYAYSIMERARLAALSGDKMLAMPFICFVGNEAWRAKEAKAAEEEFPSWGSHKERGIIWEALTAEAFIQAGADILVMRHPKSAEIIKKHIGELFAH